MKTLPGPRAELANYLLDRGPQMLFHSVFFSFSTRDQPLASSFGWSDWLNEDVGEVYNFSQKPFF